MYQQPFGSKYNTLQMGLDEFDCVERFWDAIAYLTSGVNYNFGVLRTAEWSAAPYRKGCIITVVFHTVKEM